MRIKNNKGISLMVLVISIVVLLILVGATIYRSDSSRAIAQKTVLMTDLNTIENSAKTYYIENGSFPTSEALTKDYYVLEDITALNDDVNLSNDIYYFNDTSSKFYIIDLSKIEVKNIDFGLKYNTYGDVDVFVISDLNKKVYYLKGKKIEGNKYYALTFRLTGAESNTTYKKEDTSYTSITSSESSGRIKTVNSGLDTRAIINLRSNEKIELKTSSYTKAIDPYVGENILIVKNLLTSDQIDEISTTKKFSIVLKSGDLVVEEKEINVLETDYTLTFNSSSDKVRSYDEENVVSFSLNASNEVTSVKYSYYTVYDLSLPASYSSYKENLTTSNQWIEYTKNDGFDASPNNSLICTATLPKNVKEIFVVAIDSIGNTNYDIKEVLPFYARSTIKNKVGNDVTILNSSYSESNATVKVSISYDKKSYSEIKSYTNSGEVTNQEIEVSNVQGKEAYIKTVITYNSNDYIFIDKVSF